MDITAVLALAVLVGMLVGLSAYVTVFQKQQPQQQQRAAADEDEEPVQVWLLIFCDCTATAAACSAADACRHTFCRCCCSSLDSG
jgi:hypothetical protein